MSFAPSDIYRSSRGATSEDRFSGVVVWLELIDIGGSDLCNQTSLLKFAVKEKPRASVRWARQCLYKNIYRNEINKIAFSCTHKMIRGELSKSY